jgi:hypothetical protein
MVFAERDISVMEELAFNYYPVMPKNTPAKGRDDKDDNIVDCLFFGKSNLLGFTVR